MRKGMLWLLAAGVVTVAGMGALGVAGCAAQTDQSTERPAADQLQEGLTILEADPVWGMNAAFKKANRVVYLQTRVGVMKPEVYREAFPDEPQNEMDARFVDDKGFTFEAQLGGDTWVDAAWPMDMQKGKAARPLTAEDAAANFVLAEQAAAAVAELAPAPELKQHVISLRQLSHTTPETFKPISLEQIHRLGGPAPQEVPYAGSQVLLGQLFTKSFMVVAEHSAIAAYNCVAFTGASCSYDSWLNTCNHGTCAVGGGMSYKCQSTSAWTSTSLMSIFTGESVTDLSTSGACSTGYHWWASSGHVCNDDSAYELWQIKNATRGNPSSWNGGTYDCNGDDCHWYGWCDDWSAPSCP